MLLVPTSPVISYFSIWVFVGGFRHLIFTVARNEFAVSAAVQLFQVATDSVLSSLCVDDRVCSRKLLLVA